MDHERIARLPQWAQRYISKLERDIEWHKEQLRQVASGDSPIAWEISTTATEEWQGIPKRATVRFQLGAGEIECSLRRDALQIRKRTRRGRLVAMPEAYNAMEINIVGED